MIGLFFLIVIGLVAGGLANFITHGGGLGTKGNLAVGVVGSNLGGLLFQKLGAGLTGWDEVPVLLASFGVALVMAAILLIIVVLINR